MKLFSTKVHAGLDYATVALLPVAGRLAGWDKTTVALLDTSAGAVLVYSLLTDYEGGVSPQLSMRQHFTCDQAFAATMLGGAALLPNARPSARAFLLGMALLGLVASTTTEEHPESTPGTLSL